MNAVEAIDTAYDAEPRREARAYIGASNVGRPCEAELAFSLRGFPDNEPDPRLKRIFRLGHIIEDVVVGDLRKAGYFVQERDPVTGRQWHYEDFGGHVQANCDGHIESEEELHILEVKSMNSKKWAEFKEKGVKRSHPVYYAQCQMMMGLSGIIRSFFIAYNKDTSNYHVEIVPFDAFDFASLVQKCETVLKNEATKVATDDSDWRCKGCFKRGVCWHEEEVPKNCRTCAYAHALPEHRKWYCQLHGREATDPCPEWKRYRPHERHS